MNFNYKAYEKSTGKTYGCFGFNSLEGEIYVSSLSDDEFRDGVAETIHSVTKKLNDFDILQPTGITDVNGNEIFEGDILRLLNSDVLCEVVYEAPSFCRRWLNSKVSNVRGIEIESMAHNTHIAYEVIGNICENEDLLGEYKK